MATSAPSPAPAAVIDDRLDGGLFGWIWHHSRRQQVAILALILASLPFYFLSLDLPKQIINGPLQGHGFATADARQPLFVLARWLPDWRWLQDLPLLQGMRLDRWQTLVALSLAFLALVVINGAFKLVINTAKGRLGERMLVRLRLQLFDRVLRFRPRHARQLKGYEIASIVKDEVEPLGGFIGDAYVVPVFLAGQALTAAAFILVQSVWLGLVALLVVGLQAAIIPHLRRRLIALNRQRQVSARQLAGRVGEVVDGISDVHVNGAGVQERADIRSRLEEIYGVRFEIYRRKFSVKFLNNSLAQVPPLFFYLVGGALVLKGLLDVGQLVAVIVAYKELPGPIKELIDWDYQRQDMVVQFAQTMEQFPAGELAPTGAGTVAGGDEPAAILPLTVDGLVVTGREAAERLHALTLAIAAGDRLALVGDAGCGAATLAQALVGQVEPQSGTIRFADRELRALPAGTLGRRIAFIDESPYIQQGTIEAALCYGLPPAAAATGAAEGATAPRRRERIAGLLDLVELEDEVLTFALGSRLAGDADRALTASLVEARQLVAERLATEGLSGLVVRLDADRYSEEMSIADNLVFGHVADRDGRARPLLDFGCVEDRLAADGLDRELCRIGRAIAQTALELFGDLDPASPFLASQRLVPADRIGDLAALLEAASPSGGDQPTAEGMRPLIALALSYIEPEHRLGLLDDGLRGRIISARRHLGPALEDAAGADVTLFNAGRYSDALTLEQNIVFGNVSRGIADGGRRIRGVLRSALADCGRLADVLAIGLATETGPAGRRLTLAQRQKIGLARALLKEPELIVANRPLSALGAQRQDAIVRAVVARLAAQAGGRAATLVWVLANPATADAFDRVITLEDGRIVHDGPAAAEAGGARGRAAA